MPRLSTLAGALALALAGTSVAQAQTFTGVVTFGDSLSDSGNVAALLHLPAGNSFTTNPDPVYAELVAQAFGYAGTNSLCGGTNYAYAGSCARSNSVSFTCFSDASGVGAFSVTNQIAGYLIARGGTADPNALYTIWAGGNDVRMASLNPPTAQTNTGIAALTTVGLIGSLQNAGARTIVVFNLPDLGLIPGTVGTGNQAGASGLSFVFNSTFNAGLASLGDGIVPINVFALVNEFVADPSLYGLTNVTEAACGPNVGTNSVACGPVGSGLPYSYAAGTNETYLFADGLHPTGGTHAKLANVVLATLSAPGQVSLAGELPLQVYDDHSGVINGELFANRRADRSDEEARGYVRLQFGKQTFDAAANTGEMDLNQFTATFGADFMAGESVTLGGAVSFGNSNGSTGGAGLHSREVLASAYAAANLGSVGYIDAIASVGSNNIDINRNIALGPSIRVDSGTTTAKDVAFELGGGLAFGSDDFHHGPFVSVAWQKVTVDGYAEDNTDSTSMWFSEFERKSLVGRLGYQLQATSGNFKPYARVAYAQEDKNDVTQVQAGSNSMNGHFTMNGFAPSDHWAEADVGVSYAANDSTDLVFSYHGRFSDDTQSRDAVAFEVRKTFGKPAPEPTPEAEPMPAPAPEKTCADLDDDGDGVNNCDDKCPTSEAGQAIGPDGCPVPLTIDLKGVNFDFDKATLRPDAVAILDEAIAILGKYPQLKVEVAGHTDSVGTEVYNQGLSERRAHAVYDYLTGHGIDAGRLVGPTGYGESKPIAPNTNPDGSDNPEGRAQNRRTELNVQN